MMYKQNPPSLLDTLIKMFMELGSVAVSNQVQPSCPCSSSSREVWQRVGARQDTVSHSQRVR